MDRITDDVTIWEENHFPGSRRTVNYLLSNMKAWQPMITPCVKKSAKRMWNTGKVP